MSASWDWPGSRWWRVDLHAHTPASYDFTPDADRIAKDWGRWLDAARDAGLQAIAVTDHNTSAGIDPLKNAAEMAFGDGRTPVVIFPGVELTASDGTHLLLILDSTCTASHVDDLLSKAKVAVATRGQQDARSSLSVEQLLDIGSDDVLVLGAHVSKDAGLLTHDGQQRIKELNHRRLLAVEVDPDAPIDTSWIDGKKPEIKRVIPQLRGSDSHKYEEMGRRFTWVKMTTPNLDGLRLSLLDGDASLRIDTSHDPNRHAAYIIESIVVTDGKFMGRQTPFKICFNPWLSSIIGGRGAGKSTLVDLLRVALRREQELGESGVDTLRDAFDKRLRVPSSRTDEGLLTANTVVEVVYRKDGERFVISWAPQGTVPAIGRWEGVTCVTEEGDVRERFPVRIYSQKQLFQLALEPNALLGVIDDSEEVRGAELLRRRKEVENRYLSLRAEARSLRVPASDLPGLKAALADVKRKLELLQQGGHTQALGEYRIRRRHDGIWSSILESAMEGVENIGRTAEDLAVADFDIGGSGPTTDGDAALTRAHAATSAIVSDLRSDVLDAVTRARARIEEVLAGEDLTTWRNTVKLSEQAYEDATKQLTSAGIGNPDEYRGLLERATALEQNIAVIERHVVDADSRDMEAAAELMRYRELRKTLTERRKVLISNTMSQMIQVDIDYCGGRDPDTIESFLRDGLSLTKRFDEDFRSLAARLPGWDQAWNYESLDALIQEMDAFMFDGRRRWTVKDHRFEAALRKVQPERLDRLSLFVPEDAVSVKFKDPKQGASWKPIAHGSPGQKTAALLAFVLGYGKEPIILDQPEDDLDNTLIYELVVRRLREIKPERQIIVVTHNPNVVVHGDAELVVSLIPGGGTTHIGCEGGLQEKKVREEICRVMEGGSQAFETRYRRIMHSGE